MNNSTGCAVTECDRGAVCVFKDNGKKYCESHWSALQRDPDTSRLKYIPRGDKERLMVKVKKIDGHWMWNGSLDGNGKYGGFHYKGKQRRAHRVAWELFVGPIPEGMVLDHMCRVTQCVNPDHLQVVTQRENLLIGETLQAENAKKTHCIRGHEFNDINTYFTPSGGRACRPCRRFRYKESGGLKT